MAKFKYILKKLAGLAVDEDQKEKTARNDGERKRFGVPEKAKLIFGYAWPFLALLIIFIFGWHSLKPYLGELFNRVESIKDSLYGEEEPARDPDADYEINYSQNKLGPVLISELNIEEEFMPAEDLPAGMRVKSAAELAEKLKSVPDGTALILEAGEYTLNLEIDRDMIIYGQGSSTVLKAFDPESAVIKATGGTLTLKNMAVTGGRAGIDARQGKLDIEKVKFTGHKAMAIWAEGSELALKSVYIESCDQGIGAMNSSGVIENSTVKDNLKSGVELYSGKFRISGNNISDNGSYGVFADAGSEVEISGNYVEGNRGFNVRIEGERKIYR